MTARTDVSRSLPDRQHLGQQLRDARNTIGLSQRQVAAMTGIRQCSVSYVETAGRDVLLSGVLDMAAACGRVVVVAADYHLPLLDLDLPDVASLTDLVRDAAKASPYWQRVLNKLTTTEEAQ